jgi:predicted aspartyl protease
MVAGPRLNVEVHVPEPLSILLSQQGKPIPKPIPGEALIDTGASITAVDDSVITSLGVQPVGVTTVHTPSGSAQQNQYPVRFVFPGSGLPDLVIAQAIGSVLLPQGTIALIGREALASIILVYNGRAGMFTLAI